MSVDAHGEVGRKHAQGPLVLAIDVGSSATRGRVYDATGTPVRKLSLRLRHSLTIGAGGAVTIDGEAVLKDVVQVIDGLLDGAGKLAAEIAAVAMDTFASTLVGVNQNGAAVTPVYTYADSRPAKQVAELRGRFDEDAVQQRTGARFHASYIPARFVWLQETAPDLLAKVAYWLSLGEFIYFRLLGQRAASFSTAAWTGLLDRRALTWDAELLAGLPVRVDQLPPVHDTTEPLTGLTRAFAARWPALARAKWLPAVADGYASNLGCDAVGSGTLALAIGSSAAVRALLPEQPPVVPRGLWCYPVNRREALLGGALNDGGRAIDWLRGLLRLPDDATLNAALHAPPDPKTPIVLPFLTGERNPGYAPHATASFSGMDRDTAPVAIFRGMVEGIAFRLSLLADEIRNVVPSVTRIVASGGGIDALPAWIGILADVIGLPVAPTGEGQATLRDTALLALGVIAPDVARRPAALGEAVIPDVANGAAYRVARDQQTQAYRALIALAEQHAP